MFECDGGATTDFSTQVSIVRAGAPPEDTGRPFYAADTNHGATEPAPGGGPQVSLYGLPVARPEVRVDPLAHAFLQESEAGGVEILSTDLP